MANGANDPKKIAKVFEKVAEGYEKLRKNPNAMKTIRVFDAMTDLHPAKKTYKLGKYTSKIWRKIAARRAARNEAEKAALVGGGLGAATMHQSQKNKKK